MRHIQPEMIKYLDNKLKENGFAQHCVEIKDARNLFIETQKSCVGIREVGGNNKGPLVELIQKTIGGASAEAWCMSMQQTCLAYVENKLNIRSPIYSSEHCLTVWNKSPIESRVQFYPKPGAIIIWRHGNTQNGHTGMVMENYGNSIAAIEGNTESGLKLDGSIERNGGGIYFTNRNIRNNGSMIIVGFLKPF
jgi:hypothetical protein